MTVTLIVPCPACQGEGRDIRYGLMYEPGCGHPHMGEVDYGICRECRGACVVETEITPIELYDLDDMAGEGHPDDDGRCPCGFDADRCTPHEGDCLYAAPAIKIIPPGPWVDQRQRGEKP